jgi:hypothetical protein
VLLRDTAPGETPGPVVRPDATDADPSIRYRIDGEIARGGMGAVLKGRDPDLGRDVAIKVLRADLRDNADLVRRFVEEAQIGGQLQHPGIVPVYELGLLADERPYFTMKLVKGQTLAKLLQQRSDPGDNLSRFVAIFEQAVPSSYNGFLYPLQGDLLVDGTAPQRLSAGQIGWLEFGVPSTTVRLTAGKDGSRVMLYAGERQNVPIVTHGPFVGDTRSRQAHRGRGQAGWHRGAAIRLRHVRQD